MPILHLLHRVHYLGKEGEEGAALLQLPVDEKAERRQAEEIPSNEDTAAASESDFYEEDMDAESENGQELLLEEIK